MKRTLDEALSLDPVEDARALMDAVCRDANKKCPLIGVIPALGDDYYPAHEQVWAQAVGLLEEDKCMFCLFLPCRCLVIDASLSKGVIPELPPELHGVVDAGMDALLAWREKMVLEGKHPDMMALGPLNKDENRE